MGEERVLVTVLEWERTYHLGGLMGWMSCCEGVFVVNLWCDGFVGVCVSMRSRKTVVEACCERMVEVDG